MRGRGGMVRPPGAGIIFVRYPKKRRPTPHASDPGRGTATGRASSGTSTGTGIVKRCRGRFERDHGVNRRAVAAPSPSIQARGMPLATIRCASPGMWKWQPVTGPTVVPTAYPITFAPGRPDTHAQRVRIPVQSPVESIHHSVNGRDTERKISAWSSEPA